MPTQQIMTNQSAKASAAVPELQRGDRKSKRLWCGSHFEATPDDSKTKASPTLSRETLVRTALPRSLLRHRLAPMRVGRNSSDVLHANHLQMKDGRVCRRSGRRLQCVRTRG